MKNNLKTLIICIVIPLAVGALSSLISGGGMEQFAAINKPPLAPPGWLFPVVWTALFIMMGIASYLIVVSEAPVEERANALFVYGIQLIVNFFWSIWFFNFQWYLFAFLWLLFLWVLILLTIIRFNKISKTAAYLLIPYILWVTFAGYLNLAIAMLN